MKERIFLVIAVMLVLSSCNRSREIASQDISLATPGQILLEPLDTIPLFNDTTSFTFFFYRNVEQGKVFGYNYPLLDVSEINLDSEEIIPITTSGSGPGQINHIVEPTLASNGDLYILEKFNVSKLHIFDSAYNYKKTVQFDSINKSHFPIPFQTFLQVFKTEDGMHKLLFSINSVIFDRDNHQSYDGPTIGEVILNPENNEIVQESMHLPLKEVPEIMNAIKQDKRSWQTIAPTFSLYNNFYYVIFPSLPYVYKYDMNWQFKEKFDISYLEKGYDFSLPFKFNNNDEKRLTEDSKVLLSNNTIKCSYAKEGNLFFSYKKPVDPEMIENSFNDNGSADIIQAIKLNDQKQYATLLPETFYGDKFVLLDDNKIAVMGRKSIDGEDYYLFVFKYKFVDRNSS